MTRRDPVETALDRWMREGLLDPSVAERLRMEAREHGRRSSRSLFQYLLAGTGGVVLLVAAAVFAGWVWPLVGDVGRSATLFLGGSLLVTLGQAMEWRRRWTAVSYAIQTAGLCLMLSGFLYSERVWADASVGGVLVGVACLVTPLVLAPLALRKSPVMPAVHLAFSFAFLFAFLDRATALDSETIVLVLDGWLAIAVVLLLGRIRRGSVRGDLREWELAGLVVSLYGGLVLVLLTGIGPLGMGEEAIWPLDAWMAVVLGVVLWGIHRAPPVLRRGWFEELLAASVLLAAIFTGISFGTALDASPEVVALALAAVGGGALAWAIGRESRSVGLAGSLVLLADALVYGAERGDALGAFAALLATAALLFWISTRLGLAGEDDGGTAG